MVDGNSKLFNRRMPKLNQRRPEDRFSHPLLKFLLEFQFIRKRPRPRASEEIVRFAAVTGVDQIRHRLQKRAHEIVTGGLKIEWLGLILCLAGIGEVLQFGGVGERSSHVCARCSSRTALWASSERNDSACTAKRFAGMNSGKIQASSEGRNMEKIRPTGLAGFPYPPSGRVSLGTFDDRWNLYIYRPPRHLAKRRHQHRL